MSDSLQSHGLQHAMPPCPSPTPEICSNSCPSSQWCLPTISSVVIPFSFHLQSFPASGSFQMSPFFQSGGQSIGVSALASVLPMNTQDCSPLGWIGWISLQSKGLSGVLSSTTQISLNYSCIPSLPAPSCPSRSSPEAGLPVLHNKFPLAIHLMPDCVCMLMLLSPFISLSPSPTV